MLNKVEIKQIENFIDFKHFHISNTIFFKNKKKFFFNFHKSFSCE